MARLIPLVAGFGLLGGLLGLLAFGFWLWMLIDCLKRSFKDKLLWVLIMIFLGPLGSILYFFLVKNKRR
jgi:hypothetical protein